MLCSSLKKKPFTKSNQKILDKNQTENWDESRTQWPAYQSATGLTVRKAGMLHTMSILIILPSKLFRTLVFAFTENSNPAVAMDTIT